MVEFVKFKLICMPCCGQLLCWVNPRLPNHCPECGAKVYQELKLKPEVYFHMQFDAKLESISV